jgi:hypothetical protein
MGEEGVIPELNIDMRPEIQAAYLDCINYRIQYNNTCAVQPEQGNNFKITFYSRFQKIYYLSRYAFHNKKKDKDGKITEIGSLLNDIEAWIAKLKKVTEVSKVDMEQGFIHLDKFEPYLRDRNLIWKLADD